MKLSTFYAFLWVASGFLAFYLIAFVWKDSLNDRQQWPLYPAEVASTKIIWAQHMTDEYALTVNLKVMPEHKSSYAASLQQAGPKGALQERAATHFRTGQKLQVRVNPESSSYVVLDKEPGWGPWIVASVIGFFFMAIGLTILNEPLSDK